MATLLLSDCVHERFLVTYLSDPVLTIASAQLWYEKDLLLRYALPILRQKMIHGAVLEGYLGELVGRMLLLIGMDKTCDRGYYDGNWYQVSEFMKHCFGINDCMVGGEQAFVGFSHFVPCATSPKNYHDLEDLLFRRGACCLPAGHIGADLLIPFWMRNEGKPEPFISYILIQIKNRKGRVKDDTLLLKLKPESCFPDDSELQAPLTDIISIIMQTGLTYKRPQAPISHNRLKKPPANVQKTILPDIPKQMPPAKTTPGNNQPVAKERKSPHFTRLSDNNTEKANPKKLPPDNPKKKLQDNTQWKAWEYSVLGIYPESYRFLQGQDELTNELRRLAKGSLNLNEWMKCDEALNTPSSSPGMARRKDHILHLGLAAPDE